MLSPALGIGAFAEKTLVAAGQCTKVDPAARPAAAGLLGCGVMAGLGAAINTGGVARGEDRRGDRLRRRRVRRHRRRRAGRRGHDHRGRHRRQKLEWARGFGATHAVERADADPVEAIQGADRRERRRRGDRGGRPAGDLEAGLLRPRPGRHGRPGRRADAGDEAAEMPLLDVFGRGGALKSSWYGDCLPSRDFPMLVDLYLQGRLDLDAFVSETIGLGRRRGGLRQDAPRRGAAVGGGPLMTARVDHAVPF